MTELRDEVRPAENPPRGDLAPERHRRGGPERRGHQVRNVDICGNPVDGVPDQVAETRPARGRGRRNVDICGNPVDAEPRTEDRRRGGDRPKEADGEGDAPPKGPPESPERPERGDGDEPGSWRGESGRFLNYEEHLGARHNIDRMREIEPRVTDNLRAIESDVPGASMVGLEYRLKGDDRLKDKIAKENRDSPERDLREISEDIPDAIRYTYQFDADDYARGYHDVCSRLEESGYTITHSANSWDSPDYKGINTRWRTPEGQLFEVQFHTPESFAAKQQTHDLYEKIRNPKTPAIEVGRLEVAQREIVSRVPVPAGTDAIKTFRSKG